MRTQYHHRSRAYLDRVIDGGASGDDPLIELLRQVQAPPRRRETRGLRAASSAFIWAPSVRPYLPPHHRTGLSSAAARLWHPKAIVAGLTLVAAITIGAASATANLSINNAPAATDANTHPSVHAPIKVKTTPPPSAQRSSAPKIVAPVTGSKATATVTTTVTSSPPPPWVAGSCQNWFARPPGTNDDPAFQKLVQFFGGFDAVNAYCAELLHTTTPSTPHSAAPHTHEQPSPSITPTATN